MKNFEKSDAGSEESYKKDPRYRKVLEEVSLERLRKEVKKGREYSPALAEYSGEVSEKGYLLKNDGTETNFLPSQMFSSEFLEIEEEAKKRFEGFK